MKAESGAKRVVVFDHTLRTADDADARGNARSARSSSAPTTTTPSGRGRSACAIFSPDEAEELLQPALRHHPGVAADPSSGRDLSARDLRCAKRVVRRFRDFRAPLSQPRRPDLRVKYNPAHRWYWFPRMRRDEALVFKVYDLLRTAARAGPRTPRSTIRPRRQTRGRARASRSARSRFFRGARHESLAHQYLAFPGVRGNGITSRTLARPVT